MEHSNIVTPETVQFEINEWLKELTTYEQESPDDYAIIHKLSTAQHRMVLEQFMDHLRAAEEDMNNGPNTPYSS